MRSSPGPQLQPVPARRGLHHAGPVGVDHSMELQPGPLGSMVVHHAGPAFADVHPMFADVCIMLARSALITRWNSNQVPWDPSRELHRVPARSSNQSRPPWNRLRKLHRVPAHGSLDGTPTRSPGIHGCAYFRPMDPWLCIESRPGVCRRSPNVCRRLHTFNQCLPTSAYFRPGRR